MIEHKTSHPLKSSKLFRTTLDYELHLLNKENSVSVSPTKLHES
jgi:hypothetical protein